MMNSRLPMSISVTYDENLPNGPYCELANTACRVYGTNKMTLGQVLDLFQKEFKTAGPSASSMTAKVEMELTILEVKFKGAEVSSKFAMTLEQLGLQSGDNLNLIASIRGKVRPKCTIS